MSHVPKTRHYAPGTLARLIGDGERTRAVGCPPPLPRGVAGKAPRAREEAAARPPSAAASPPPTVVLSASRAPGRKRRGALRKPAWRWLLGSAATLLVVLGAAVCWRLQPAAAGRAPRVAVTPAAAAPAVTIVEAEPAQAAPSPGEREPTSARPATAVAQLAAGDYHAALDSYRALGREHPEREVYAVVVAILERRHMQRCRQNAAMGSPCE
jgi:hypothetical protein